MSRTCAGAACEVDLLDQWVARQGLARHSTGPRDDVQHPIRQTRLQIRQKYARIKKEGHI